MNTVFLIGNGFDINLGIPTRYSDFYKKHYSKLKSENNVITNFISEIKENHQNWSDLELAFGEYTKHINSEDDFNAIFEHLIDNLADYLEAEEGKFDIARVQVDALLNYIKSPEKTLPFADQNKISDFRNYWKDSNWYNYLITFNYTSILDNVLDGKLKNFQLSTHHNGAKIFLNGLEHIHGNLVENMVLGVNEVEQVSNSHFRDNINVKENIIKPYCNNAQKHGNDTKCEKLIEKANLICVFGSSIGLTDRFWWNLIGQKISSDKANCKLIIFERVFKTFNKRRSQEISKIEREVKEKFLNITDLDDSSKTIARDNIIVGVNTGFLDFNKKNVSLY